MVVMVRLTSLVIPIVGMPVRGAANDFGWLFPRPIRQTNIDLRRTESAAIHPRNIHSHPGKAEAFR